MATPSVRPRARRSAAVVAACATFAAVALSAGPAAAAVIGTGVGLKPVWYAGYRFEVPAAWPVFNLSLQPRTCVRFDLHAVYLGTPAADQNCPSWLLGATEALLIRAGPRGAARQSRQNPVSDLITATAPGIAVTATFDTDPARVASIVESAGLAAPLAVTGPVRVAARAAGRPRRRGAPGVLAASATRDSAAAAGAAMPLPELPPDVADDVGLSFDTCAAPSGGVMRAWRQHSPYQAVGIYIGGADRTCDQQNLTPSWVRQQAAAGWRFLPMYAGPQPVLGQLTAPARQGTADAADAVAQAERLGFGPGTPLYYDLEAYPPAESLPALRFLSAWTTGVHRLGYASGVYATSDSGIADLARQYRTGRYAMPDVIDDAEWNGEVNTADSHYLRSEWPGARRVHQFSGSVPEAFGGRALLIDQSYMDVALASPGGTAHAAAAVTTSGGWTAVFYAGPAHQLVEQAATAGGQWTRTYLGGDLTSAPTAVQAGASTIDVFYRGADDRLWVRTRTGAGWRPARRLADMGVVDTPAAVAQPNGVVDVFWRSRAGDRLWHAQYNPDSGWAGPQDLQGRLDSPPYPVEAQPGQVQVFWAGPGGSLWRVVRGLAGNWSGPQDLGVGVLGGAPQAVPVAGGQVDVFWRGATGSRFVMAAVVRPGVAVVGPVSPGGALGTGQPWAVSAAGRERLLFRGRYGGLRMTTRGVNGRWTASVRITGVAGMVSSPVAAAGPASGPLVVFWTGRRSQLWAIWFTRAAGWSTPVDLGGTAG